MHRNWIRILAAAAAVLLLGLLVSPFTASAADEDDTTVLRVGVPNDLTSANPLSLRSNSDWNVATIQYDMPMMFGNEDLSAQAGLIESCEPNEQLTVWVCTVRDDVVWSDGTPMTSKDIRFTYELIMDQEISTYDSYFALDPTFETPDDTTLIWKSPKPTYAPLTPPWLYVLPEHVWSEYADLPKEELRTVENVPTVTTGPFSLSEVDTGQGWTLKANPNYWGDTPNYDEIQFKLFTNQDAMAAALKNGEIDVATYFETALLPALDGDENITVQRNVSDWWLNLAFNFGGDRDSADPLPALQDKTLRTAIAMAIDKQGIVDKAYNGAAVPGESVIRLVPEIWHYDVPDEDVLPFDPAAANAMLDDAGYERSGDGVRIDPQTGDELQIRMPISQETPGALIAGQLIEGYLKEIGVQVTLLPVNEGKMYSYWKEGNWDAYIWYWTGEPDPNYQLSTLTSNQCLNLSDGCWSNAEYDKLFKQQQPMVDPEERQAVVHDMLALVYEENPSIALAYPSNIEAYRNDMVQNFTPVPGDNGYLIPNYNNIGMVTVEPVSGAASDSSSSSGLPAWAWGAIAIAVLGVGFMFYRRGNSPDDDEG